MLKLLQKSYLGKVKMIYIDPPYNTGNDFIYPDDLPRACKLTWNTRARLDSRGERGLAPIRRLMGGSTPSG